MKSLENHFKRMGEAAIDEGYYLTGYENPNTWE